MRKDSQADWDTRLAEAPSLLYFTVLFTYKPGTLVCQGYSPNRGTRLAEALA